MQNLRLGLSSLLFYCTGSFLLAAAVLEIGTRSRAFCVTKFVEGKVR